MAVYMHIFDLFYSNSLIETIEILKIVGFFSMEEAGEKVTILLKGNENKCDGNR